MMCWHESPRSSVSHCGLQLGTQVWERTLLLNPQLQKGPLWAEYSERRVSARTGTPMSQNARSAPTLARQRLGNAATLNKLIQKVAGGDRRKGPAAEVFLRFGYSKTDGIGFIPEAGGP